MAYVSICIPTYNGARYLEACLDSVLGQTYKDIEILAVDDGSTDNTLEILEHYSASDQRIRLVRNEHNLGLVGNWNRCIELARGEWIKFVFQDDLIAPGCIERMLSACETDTTLVACAREFLFDQETTQEVREWYWKSESTIREAWGKEKKISAEKFCQATLGQLGTNLIGEPTSVLLHRRVFQIFGDFNPVLIMSCDLEYWARVAVHTGLMVIAEPLATFRVHGGATSSENRASRGYRMDVLDDLVILHEFAFHSAYEPLRAAAAKQQPLMDMEAIFLAKAKWARNIAEHAANDSKSPDPSLLKDWVEVARSYPGISAIPRQHGFWGRLRGCFRRHSPVG